MTGKKSHFPVINPFPYKKRRHTETQDKGYVKVQTEIEANQL